jgi:LemA protein
MSAEPWLLAGTAALLVFWTLGAHNRLVSLRNAIIAAWSQVDEPLGRRAAALQPLLAALQTALPDERPTCEAVTAAQAQVQAAADALRARPADAARAAALACAESDLSAAVARLQALLEPHAASPAAPERAAQAAALADATQRLAFARQLFNDAVRRYNEAAQQFPTSVLSRMFGFGPAGVL